MAHTDTTEYIKLLEEKLTKQVLLNKDMVQTLKEQEKEIHALRNTLNEIRESSSEIIESIDRLDVEPVEFIVEEVCYSKTTTLKDAIIFHN